MDHQPLRRKYGSAHTQLTRIFEVQGDRRFGGLCRPSRVVLHHRRQSDRRWRNERL